MPNPVAIIILDGLGYREEDEYNAVKLAHTPYLDDLWVTYPHTTMAASAEAVGLPSGQIGNSEVGHTNIGAGRVVYQSLTRINQAIADGELKSNPILQESFNYVKDSHHQLHIFGLLSDGQVHSHQEHLYAILQYAKEAGLDQVYLHLATDGRDVAPDSALAYVRQLKDKMNDLGIGKIASLSGRYYSMDRDHRWQRTQLAYDVMVNGQGLTATDAEELVQHSYEAGVTDEFIKPHLLLENDQPVQLIQDGDAVLFFNFRSDRVRQLSQALIDPDFDGFDRKKVLKDLHFTSMMDYGEQVDSRVIFQPQLIKNPLGQVVAEAGLRQLRIAETEKYPHVTYFMNGGQEVEFEGEDRLLVPSPQVETYDLKPEMSAYEIADQLVPHIKNKDYDLYILNFANPDMVGHTGQLDAAIQAVEAVDVNLKKVVQTLLEVDGTAIIFADHGNAERMRDEQGKPHTAHTTAPVPVIVTQTGLELRQETALCDIAPTALELLGIEPAEEMTGQSIIEK